MISANTFGAACVVKDEIKAGQYSGSDYQVDHVRMALFEVGCDVRVDVAKEDASHLLTFSGGSPGDSRCALTDGGSSARAIIKLENIYVTSEGRVIRTDALSAIGRGCGRLEYAASKASKKLAKLIKKKMI
jgi:hypothetical protein